MPAIIGCEAEVQAGGLGVANVQVAIGFRGKAGYHIAAEFTCLVVVGDYGAYEVMPGGGFGFSRLRHSW
jgi:hypothetical protein